MCRLKTTMKRKKYLVSTLATALFLFACGTAPVKNFYTLENTSSLLPDDDTPPLCSLSLGLDPIETAPPYDMSKIVFRPDMLEVRFYMQSHWVSPPEEMFAKLIGRRIEAAHLFSAVGSSVNVSGPHLSLLIKLYTLEEVDKGKDWQGRLAMSLFLRDEMEDRILWKYRFDITKQASKAEVKAVVEVLNRIYNEEMDKAVNSMKAVLAQGGCRISSANGNNKARIKEEPEEALEDAPDMDLKE